MGLAYGGHPAPYRGGADRQRAAETAPRPAERRKPRVVYTPTSGAARSDPPHKRRPHRATAKQCKRALKLNIFILYFKNTDMTISNGIRKRQAAAMPLLAALILICGTVSDAEATGQFPNPHRMIINQVTGGAAEPVLGAITDRAVEEACENPEPNWCETLKRQKEVVDCVGLFLGIVAVSMLVSYVESHIVGVIQTR